MAKSLEDTYIENIENAIRAIRLGTKKPQDTSAGFNLNRLKEVNPGMHEDLMKQYKAALLEYKAKLLGSQGVD